jgi:protein CpxP
MTLRHTALAATLILASAATARAEHGDWHHGGPGMVHGYLEFLHGVTLTDAQKSQIHDIEKAGWTQMKSNFQQMRTVHEQIMSQLASTNAVSKDQIDSLVRQEAKLRGQADVARMAQVLAVRNVLTADQLAQAASIHQQMAALHEQEHALMQPPAAQ